MEEMIKSLSKMDILLCGLAITSRTETIEEYLKDKVQSLTVIVISSCFLKENHSFCRVYEKGVLHNEFKLPNFRIKDYKWYRQPLVLLFFIINWISLSWAILKVKRRFDLCICISQSFALWGVVLKKIAVTRHLLYYCGDYYIPGSTINFNNLLIKFISLIDRLIVRNSDYIWDVSSNIAEYRERIGKVKGGSYKNIVVPLGYSRHLRKFRPMEEINRWDIGFVGTITASQGLQLLVEAMPGIIKKVPAVKVKIIGQGPFSEELKEMISRKGLDSYFALFGFIKEEGKMLEIISRCAVGIALWDTAMHDKNIICADPGKTKLYALCGLPIIVTRVCNIEKIIQNAKAGIVIEYKKEDLVDAVESILSSDERLKEFRANSFNLGNSYISDTIFDNAFRVVGNNMF